MIKTIDTANFPLILNCRMLASEEADAAVFGEGDAKVGCAMLCVFACVLFVLLSAVPFIAN